MKDKNGVELKVGDKVDVLGKAGIGWRKGVAIDKKEDGESFAAVVVGFSGKDQIIVVEGEKDTGGPRFSLTSEQVELVEKAA